MGDTLDEMGYVCRFSTDALRYLIERTDEESLTITAEENLLPMFISTVKDGVLYLTFAKGNSFHGKRPTYKVTVKELRHIHVQGGVAIEASKLESEKLSILVEGAAGGNLSGRVDDLTIEIKGAGQIGAGELKAKRAKISVQGAGQVTVNASDELDAEVLGAGIIFYSLCELLPKMLFRLYPNRLCMVLAAPFRVVHFGLRPLVSLMSLFAQVLLRWSGGRKFTGRLFGSRDELRMLMQESAQGLTTEERAMINRVLDLQNLSVGQIAIPLNKTASAPIQTPVSELLALSRERGFNRLPIWKMEEGRQRIVGMASLRALLFAEDLDLGKTAGDYMSPALFLDKEMRLEVALRQMQRTGQRLAVVLGPERVELGVISLQDILRVIFGEVRL